MSSSIHDFGSVMRRFKTLAATTAVCAIAAGMSLSANAQDAAPPPAETPPILGEPVAAPEVAPEVEIDPDAVVATVNGEPITERDLQITAQFMGEQLTQFPEEAWREILIEVAIEFKLMGAAAAAIELDQATLFQAEMELLRDRLLRDDYIAEVITPTVTEEDINAAYVAAVAGMNLPDEVLIRHIMVASEAEATDIIRRVEAGEDFAELAFELSLDRITAEEGGLIDEYWERGELIQELDDVVFTVESGGILPFPVAIGENWHVIKVDERRIQPPPAFEELRGALEQQLVTDAYANAVEALRAEADVVIVGQEATEAAPAEEIAPPADPAGEVAPPATEEAAPPAAEEVAPPAEEAAPPAEEAAPPAEETDPPADDAAPPADEEAPPAAPAEEAGAAEAAGAVETAMVVADPVAGEAAAGICLGCHTVDEGGANLFGPNLFGVFGELVANDPDFGYSPALLALNADGAVWTGELLDAFLANPQDAAPGTTMPFGGIADETERANLIAFLATLTAE